MDSIPVLPLPSRMPYGELLKRSVPQFPHLQTREGEEGETAASGFSGKLNEFIYVEYLLLSRWEGSLN